VLSAFAIRLIYQQALLGQTWAGNSVLNSPMDPLAGLVDTNSNWSPVIAIFSGETTATVEGQDMSGVVAKCALNTTIYVPPSAVIAVDDGQDVLELHGKGTLATFALDMIEFQARQALLNPSNPWAALWPRFVTNITEYKLSPPFLEVDEGLRVPARTVDIEYLPLNDPTPGRPMTGSWAALYALMAAQTTLAPLAEMLKTAIETPGSIPDWSRVIMQLGISGDAAFNVGLGPLADGTIPPDQIASYETDITADPTILAVP
jgi:hypothetical protein